MQLAFRSRAVLILLFVASARAPMPVPWSAWTLTAQNAVPRVVDGSVTGVVVESGTTRGVPDASVTLTWQPLSSGAAPPVQPAPRVDHTLTTSAGRFEFKNLAGGRYLITVAKDGYVDGAFGKERPTSSAGSLDLAQNEQKTGVRISIWKLASISGAVQDDSRNPVVGNPVQVLQRTYNGGHLRWASGPIVTTDDRGNFRFQSLPPGEYVVVVPFTQTTVPAAVFDALSDADASTRAHAASELQLLTPPNIATKDLRTDRFGDLIVQSRHFSRPTAVGGPSSVYTTVFYSDALEPSQALPVSVDVDEEKSDIDLTLKAVPAYRLHGTVTGPDGPVPGATVRLLPEGLDELISDRGLEAATGLTDGRGGFTLLGVPSGQYSLQVVRQAGPGETPSPDTPDLWATVPVSVRDADVLDVDVTAQPGLRFSGRVVFDGTTSPPAPQRLKFMVDPADGKHVGPPVPLTTPNADGTFTTAGVLPGRYLLRMVSLEPPGWSLRSAMTDRLDLLDTPIDLTSQDVTNVTITLTDRPTSLSGTVHDVHGSGDPAATVVVFAADTRYWVDFGSTARRMRMTRATGTGQFVITGLPPSEYFLVAIPDVSTNSFHGLEDMLDTLSRSAIRVALAEHESKTASLITVLMR